MESVSCDAGAVAEAVVFLGYFKTIKHIALNLIRQAPGKDSIRLKRKVAAWDDDFLATVIAP